VPYNIFKDFFAAAEIKYNLLHRLLYHLNIILTFFFGGVVYLRISYVKYPNNVIQTTRYLQVIFRYGSEKVTFPF